MAGIFTIKPRYRSDIVCTLGESTTVKYMVTQSRINWNEQDRVKIAYASGGNGGFASGEQRGLSQASFEMVIFGDDLADAMSGLRTVTQALTSEWGGYIQYRPRGLASGVLSTYYHYLQSPPPAIQGQGNVSDFGPNIVQAGRTHKYAIRCQCAVMIKAWATSDPETLVSIVTETAMQNRDDGTYDNFVIVPDSSIKGDAIIPVVKITLDPGTAANSVIVHKRRMIVGSNTNLDYIEAEDATSTTEFSSGADVACSGGNCLTSTDANAQFWKSFTAIGFDSTYLGNISILACVYIPTGSTYTIEAGISADGSSYLSSKERVSLAGTSTWKLLQFGGISLPPSALVERFTDDTTIEIGPWATKNIGLLADFSRTAGSGECKVDFFVLAKEGEFLGTFTSFDGNTVGAYGIFIDAVSDVFWVDSLSDSIINSFVLQGRSADQLIMGAGFDYRLRFFSHLLSSDLIVQGESNAATIYGIYGTIFPFEES